MRDQKIRRAYHKFINEARKDSVKDHIVWASIIIFSLLAVLLKSWIPEYIPLTAGAILIVIVAYLTRAPEMSLTDF